LPARSTAILLSWFSLAGEKKGQKAASRLRAGTVSTPPGVCYAECLMDSSGFSPEELDQIAAHGISLEDALRQLALYADPPAYTRLLRPCRAGDGLRVLGEEAAAGFARAFSAAVADKTVVKLVPASGAASRMFKEPLGYLNSDSPVSTAQLKSKKAVDMLALVSEIERFAFYDDLAAAMRRDRLQASADAHREDIRPLLAYLLTAKGLDYASLPKALLKFHGYPQGARTAFEEHLAEAAAYARGAGGRCRLPFTVSDEHQALFNDLAARVVSHYSDAHGVEYDIDYSTQSPSTDAIAVDLDNRPFHDSDGSLLFRPGGHGALIANLGRIDADIVFVKNIDNVVPDHLKGPTYHWKKVLAGLLIELQEQVFAHLAVLEAADCSCDAIEAAVAFLSAEIGVSVPADLSSPGERRQAAISLLERPLRVCGMVRNTGEPGGGPFWVEKDGRVSAQVVETSQVDPDDSAQRAVLAAATHFNPVDLVCAFRDRHGKPYELSRYIDADAVFIAEKSSAGRPLKSLERPGLWNGAMAGWNSIFVEVPIETFNPVKTVNDLLRRSHQPPQ